MLFGDDYREAFAFCLDMSGACIWVPLLVTVTKNLAKALMDKEFVSLSWWKGMVVGVWSRGWVCSHSQEAERDEYWNGCARFDLVREPSQWNGDAHIQSGFLCLSEISLETYWRSAGSICRESTPRQLEVLSNWQDELPQICWHQQTGN